MPFECVECGYSDSKWMGRCPRCNEWDTMSEIDDSEGKPAGHRNVLRTEVQNLSCVKVGHAERVKSGWNGFDRLSGGGIVEGEVILFGGPPGVGKSTMFLQLAERFANAGKKIFFVSGEENPQQLKVHADRLKIKGDNITVLGSGDLSEIKKVMDDLKPDMLFVDSIQAVIDPEYGGAPGDLKQVKKSGQRLTSMAKNTGIMVFISGQITKQGDIAGPKVLEHMVDAVVYMDYLDGNLRIVSAVKNRFGSCGDFVLYTLGENGLRELDDIDRVSAGELKTVSGQTTACIRTGSRLIIVELQALVVNSYFEYPLRRTSGFSRERLLMLNAIVEKYLHLKLGSLVVFFNVSGGNKVTERLCDLGVIGAIYSGLSGIGVSNKFIFLGEVGLNGEVRPGKDMTERVKFALRNNFEKVILSGYGKKINDAGIELEYIRNVSELKDIIKNAK